MTVSKTSILQPTTPTWIFSMRYLLIFFGLLLSACSSVGGGKGQVIYHWEREHTGIAKFSRDHSECLKEAEGWFHFPDISNWFYTEEYRYNIHVDWHQDKGIWASYVPYRGASPILVNSIRDSADSNPKDYRLCMEKKGYWHRRYNIPTVTNVFVYNPQKPSDRIPFEDLNY